MGDAQDGRLVEGLPEDLETDRQASLKPQGTAMPGMPAMLAGIVKTSARYIWYGIVGARADREGDRGRGRRDDRVHSVANASSKSCLISVRTFCALT